MLFDLQSRGRRNFVRVIYLGLAVLMGAGFLLFGVGVGTGGGGFLDIFNNNGSSTSAQISTLEKRANRAVRLNPQSAQAWADLTRARYQTAGLGDNYDSAANQGQGQFTRAGLAKLGQASTAWQRYLKLQPNHPDASLARQMATAYSQIGLDQPADAAEAMEVVTEEQPSAAAYGTLAQYAYLAGQTRKGDLASAKSVQLAPAAQRKLVRAQLLQFKRQALEQAAQRAIQHSGSTQVPKSGRTQGVG